MFVSCQRSMRKALTLRPIREIDSLFCFYVLVEEHGEPRLVGIRPAIRSSTPVALEPGQTPVTTTEGLQRAAVALSSPQRSHSVKPTWSNGTILLELDGKDDTFWSQYSVDAGRIVPLRAASFARRDLASAFVSALVTGLMLLALTIVGLAALRTLRRLTASIDRPR